MSVAVHKLGAFIERCDERNTDLRLGLESVMGMNLSKEVIPTKANLSGNDLSNFKVVHPGDFIYNPRTHGKRIGLAYNNDTNDFLISWNNAAFRIKDASTLMPLYLYMYFLRDEWDREACYQSWGSSTEVFSWEALCEMKLPIPSIEEQRKAVEVWQGLRKMKEENEQFAEPLMQLCRSYLEECKKKWPLVELGPMIEERNERNVDEKYNANDCRGVTSAGEFDLSRATLDGIDFSKYKVIESDVFAYNPSRINLGSIALNKVRPCIVSPMYIAFLVCVRNLLPEFLELWFRRSEFQRSTLFFASGSVRDTFSFTEMCRVKIPLPPLEVQQAIVDVYRCASEAKKIAAEADGLSRAVCPALVRGAGDYPDGAGRSNTPEEGCLTAGAEQHAGGGLSHGVSADRV